MLLPLDELFVLHGLLEVVIDSFDEVLIIEVLLDALVVQQRVDVVLEPPLLHVLHRVVSI